MRWSSRVQLTAVAAGLLVLQSSLPGVPRPRIALPAAQTSASPAANEQSLPGRRSLLEKPKSTEPEFVVVIDPGHGGDDHGATLPDKVQEKDLTLTLARELRKQLEERGIHAKLLREADFNLSLDRRAETANQEPRGVYISIHAGTPGKGIRIYSAALGADETSRAGFIPWNRGQANSLDRSRRAANLVADELRKAGLPASTFSAPLRPLDNVVIPAISLEWAPEVEDLRPPQSPKSARLISAVATGMERVHAAMEIRP